VDDGMGGWIDNDHVFLIYHLRCGVSLCQPHRLKLTDTLRALSTANFSFLRLPVQSGTDSEC
jgi:hypothetical protein